MRVASSARKGFALAGGEGEREGLTSGGEERGEGEGENDAARLFERRLAVVVALRGGMAATVGRGKTAEGEDGRGESGDAVDLCWSRSKLSRDVGRSVASPVLFLSKVIPVRRRRNLEGSVDWGDEDRFVPRRPKKARCQRVSFRRWMVGAVSAGQLGLIRHVEISSKRVERSGEREGEEERRGRERDGKGAKKLEAMMKVARLLPSTLDGQ
jgi:hypothetical protein